jgi:hypothetical protein
MPRSQTVLYLSVPNRRRSAPRQVPLCDRVILLAVFVFLVVGALTLIDRASARQQSPEAVAAKTAQVGY